MPALPSKLRRARLLPLLAALAAAVALVAAACGGGSSGGGAASFLPAGTPFYVDFTTDLSSAQAQQADELLQRFPAAPAGGIEAVLEDAFEDQGLNFETQIRPLLGERAAIGVPAAPSVSADGGTLDADAVGDTQAILVFELAEGQEEATAQLLVTEGDFREAGERGGITYYRNDSGNFVAVGDGALVVAGDEETLLVSLDARESDETLAASDKFDDVMSKLPEEALARTFVDFAPFLSQVAEAGDNLGVGNNLQQLQEAALGATATAEADGLSFKGVLVGFPDVASTGTAFSTTGPINAPANTVFYLRFANLSATVAQVVEQVRQNAEGDAAQQIDALTTQLPALLGVTLEQLDALFDGQIEIVVTPGRAGVPGLGLVATVTDGEAAQATLDTLRTTGTQTVGSQLFSGAEVPEWRPVPLANGVRGWRLEINDDFSIVYAVDGNRVIIASSPLTARTLQAPASSLADSEAFKTATQGIPDQVTLLAWLNTDSAILVAQGADAIPPDQREALRNLRTIEGLAAWTTGGDDPTFEVFVPIAG